MSQLSPSLSLSRRTFAWVVEISQNFSQSTMRHAPPWACFVQHPDPCSLLLSLSRVAVAQPNWPFSWGKLLMGKLGLNNYGWAATPLLSLPFLLSPSVVLSVTGASSPASPLASCSSALLPLWRCQHNKAGNILRSGHTNGFIWRESLPQSRCFAAGHLHAWLTVYKFFWLPLDSRQTNVGNFVRISNSTTLSLRLSVCLFVPLLHCLSVRLPCLLHLHLSVCPSVCLSFYASFLFGPSRILFVWLVSISNWLWLHKNSCKFQASCINCTPRWHAPCPLPLPFLPFLLSSRRVKSFTHRLVAAH